MPNGKFNQPRLSRHPIKIVLADDEAAVRQGLRMRLARQRCMTVVGEAADGEAALAMIQGLLPDVVVMDIEMPRLDGITVTRRARVLVPRSRVVILTVSDDVHTRERARSAGAAALVGKLEDSQVLVQAILAAAAVGTGRGE